MIKHETHNPYNVWHVYADNQWHAMAYDGYAPVTVTVNGRMHSVEYRHMGLGCTDRICAGLTVRDENLTNA